MDLYQLPVYLRLALAIIYFTGTIRSVMNFYLMSFRWRRYRLGLWITYFVFNLSFNSLMTMGLLIIQVQSEGISQPLLSFQINWLFLLPIVSHLILLAVRLINKQQMDWKALSLIIRIGIMTLLLPIPGSWILTPDQQLVLFVWYSFIWLLYGLHYLYLTGRYLSSHFSDYTKLKAFELYPHGLVVTTPQGKVLSINVSANEILSRIDITNQSELKQILESGLYKKAGDTYRINPYSMLDMANRIIVWEIIRLTPFYNIQSEIDQSTAAIKNAWEIVRNILNQLKKSVQDEERVRFQQHLHDVMGEAFSIMSYSLQSMEGREITDEERFQLLRTLDQLYLVLEDRSSGGSEHSFQNMQKSFDRIGLKLNFHGDYPTSYPYRHLTYQILREAANNSLKHGKADQVNLFMEHDAECYRFTITNNGSLINPPNEQGMGLKGMRRLVNNWQGKIEIDPEQHYRIEVSLPIDPSV